MINMKKCTLNFHIKPALKLCSVRHAINAALAVFCGCLQMIATTIDTFSTITETQSKLHHSRACRESAALDMKRLRAMTKNTKENKRLEIQLQWKSSLFK